MDGRHQGGLTLLELLITMTISATLVVYAIPNTFALINNTQLGSKANSFIGSYNLARIEATKQNHPINLCAREGNLCSEQAHWENGWIIFKDENNNLISEPNEILHFHEALPSNYTFTPNIDVSHFIFHGNGYVRKANGSLPLATFRLCAPDATDSNITTHSRELVINGSGRIRLQYGREDTTQCN